MPNATAPATPRALLERLIGRMQEGDRVVSGWSDAVLAGHCLDRSRGITPCGGLVRSFPEPLRTEARASTEGYEFSTEMEGRLVALRFWARPLDSTITTPPPLAQLFRMRAYARQCFVWLAMLLPCSTDQAGSRSVVCDFFLLPHERQYPAEPGAPLAQVNCNGGVSYIGQEEAQFCVYREEELFKVFVHETFHAFAVHGAFPSDARARELTGLSDRLRLEYSEVYAETWARVVQVLFSLGDTPTVDMIRKGLRCEAAYGWRGCLCVLPRVAQHPGRRQSTPAFEYYCMTGVVMVQHDGFLAWCAQHNRRCEQGVGFELRNPEAWLTWLGGVVCDGLGRAGYQLSHGEVPTCPRSARMTTTGTFVPCEIDSLGGSGAKA